MSSISVTLIRNTHSDFNIDDIESLKVIRLNKQGIDLIDNLEVFSHIEELHLAGNLIRRIENIEFLSRLHLLDLSNNLITSESLNSSIGLLPQNIRTLILTGNPCTGDKYVLDAVQKGCDGLTIIANDTTETSNRLSELKIDALKIDSLKSVDYKRGEYEGDVEDTPLNADEVLQSLVERKCRLQNMEVFDIIKAVETLNTEYDLALKMKSEKNKTRRKQSADISEKETSRISYQKRVDDLISGAAADGTAMNDFKLRLAQKVKAAKLDMKRDRLVIDSTNLINEDSCRK